MFQWTTLALYVTFVDASVFVNLWNRIRERVGGRNLAPVLVSYDRGVLDSRRGAEVLRALDIFGRLRLVDQHERAAADSPVVAGVPSLLRIAPRLWSVRRHSRPVAAAANVL
jgi:hypothetical protein